MRMLAAVVGAYDIRVAANERDAMVARPHEVSRIDLQTGRRAWTLRTPGFTNILGLDEIAGKALIVYSRPDIQSGSVGSSGSATDIYYALVDFGTGAHQQPWAHHFFPAPRQSADDDTAHPPVITRVGFDRSTGRFAIRMAPFDLVISSDGNEITRPAHESYDQQVEFQSGSADWHVHGGALEAGDAGSIADGPHQFNPLLPVLGSSPRNLIVGAEDLTHLAAFSLAARVWVSQWSTPAPCERLGFVSNGDIICVGLAFPPHPIACLLHANGSQTCVDRGRLPVSELVREQLL